MISREEFEQYGFTLKLVDLNSWQAFNIKTGKAVSPCYTHFEGAIYILLNEN